MEGEVIHSPLPGRALNNPDLVIGNNAMLQMLRRLSPQAAGCRRQRRRQLFLFTPHSLLYSFLRVLRVLRGYTRVSAIARFARADILFCHALKINSDRENLSHGSVPKFG